jgi:EARP and GARP complex-interacting protein 1
MTFAATSNFMTYLRKPMEIQQAHEINVRCLDYNPNRPNYIVSGGDDCVVRIWDTRNSKTPVKEISDHTHWIWGAQFNRYHDQLLLTCSSDAQVNLQSVISISSATLRLFSPTMSDEETEITEPPVDGLVAAFEQHEESVYSVSWSPADPWIFASVSFDGRVVINQVPQEHKYKILSV